MEEIREGVEETKGEEEVGEASAALPTQMQLLSTWEVRRVPHNCVTRLCTLTVTRLEVKQCLEPSLPSLVVAVAMKTPHRFLRSNEIPLPPSGILDIPLKLTFSLQYPHFLKRSGNILQLRVQRRKRYRNRPIGGYKSLAMGTIEMSQVLQAGYVGEVPLFSGKPPQPLALVTVGNLTSSPVYMEPQREVSSDEEEDDIVYSDYHGSDSDSGEGDGVYRHTSRSHKLKNKSLKPSSRMLRLLGIKSSKTQTAVDELLDLQGEDPESAVTFASSVSDSEDDEEMVGGPSTPPRPTLSPFYGSDRCSMVSIPNSVRSAEVGLEVIQQASSSMATSTVPVLSNPVIEEMETDNLEKVKVVISDDVMKRVWLVNEVGVAGVLQECGETVLVGNIEMGREEMISRIHELLSEVFSLEDGIFMMVVIGEDWHVSCLIHTVLQFTTTLDISSSHIRIGIIPTCTGIVGSRLWLLEETLPTAFPLDTEWKHITSSSLLQYVNTLSYSHSMLVAHVLLHHSSTQESSSSLASPVSEPTPLPFIFGVSIGSLDAEWEQLQPNSPPSASSGSEATELVVEYWKEKEKTSSLKVRCVNVVCDGQAFNVTTLSRDKRGKGIRIRKKEKEGESGGSIISLSTSQLLCRPTNKQDCLSVVVDGVEWRNVNSVKIIANVGQSVSIATSTSTLPAIDISTDH